MRILVLLALALTLACPATGQALRGGGNVTIDLDPELPVVGLPVSATVRFETLRPETVTLFFRAVGTRAFQSIDAPPTGEEGAFRVALPIEVPRSGFDVFAEYLVDGEIRTEPEEAPRERPLRIPAIVPIARSPASLPAREYRMVTVPLLLGTQLPPEVSGEAGSDDPIEVFSDDYGAPSPSLWRLLRFDPRREIAVDLLEDPQGVGRLRPGAGFWLITSTGGGFDVELGLSAGVGFDGSQPFPVPVEVPVEPGWNQIGNPFLFDVVWDDVGQSGQVEDPVAFRGSYAPGQSVLPPWEGFFVFNRGAASVLRFDALPDSPSLRETPAERLLRRAGPGGYLLTVQATDGRTTDRVTLGVAAADGFDLHKPPAVDASLRVVARDGDQALAAHVVPNGAPAEWTLDIADFNRPFQLTLTEQGERRGALAVRDADTGRDLPVVAGRVEVPAGVRRLTVRAGSAESPSDQGLQVGVPYPAPARDGLTVPYAVGAAGPVRIAVYDLLGRTVRVLHDAPLDAGAHDAQWDGRDASGRRVASGLFLVRITTPSASVVARATVLH